MPESGRLTTFLDEVVVDAGEAPLTMELLADRSGATGPLMVRNASGDGPSVATVMDVAPSPWPSRTSGRRRCHDRASWRTGAARMRRSVSTWPRRRACVASIARRTDHVRWVSELRPRIVPTITCPGPCTGRGPTSPTPSESCRPRLAPGDVFLDVGANAGIVTVAAAAWVGPDGRVIAVEPSSREFARLERLVALNRLAHVTAMRAAVAAEAGQRMLRVAAPPGAGMNTLGDGFPYAG